ncbi:MAG: Atu1372/SO_1960 family protein [Chitinophagaceae bacterium]
MFFITVILQGIFRLFSAASDTVSYDITVGSYTQKGNAGIEFFNVQPETGKTVKTNEIKNNNASFICFSPDKKFMYAVHEEGSASALLSAYKKNSTGKYEILNTETVKGSAACHVNYNPQNATVYVANYMGGSISVFKTFNGKLLPISQYIEYPGKGANTSRQEKSHAHNVMLSPDFHYLYVSDLGTDHVHRHKIYADGLVDENYVNIQIDPGNGPRHLIFNDDGTKAYLINELKGIIDVFNVGEKGFEKIQSIVADTSKSNKDRGSADIHLSPNGKWLISSNRVTCNDLAVFSVLSDGSLKAALHQPVGIRPRNFSFSPDGKFVFVACQDDDKVQIFSFNNTTGQLNDMHRDISVKMPVYVNVQASSNEIDANERIQSLGIQLTKPSSPIANYVKVSQTGNLVYVSGHGPELPNGDFVKGKLGKDLTVEQGQDAARRVGISMLSTLANYLGDLNRVKKIVKVLGFVNSDPAFTDQPLVLNGFSNLMVDVFGARGKHARSAIGTNTLPRGMAVEVEMVLEVE